MCVFVDFCQRFLVQRKKAIGYFSDFRYKLLSATPFVTIFIVLHNPRIKNMVGNITPGRLSAASSATYLIHMVCIWLVHILIFKTGRSK